MRNTFRSNFSKIAVLFSTLAIISTSAVSAEEIKYPYKTDYSGTIESADESLFRESNINRPLNVQFESTEDLISSNELSLSEDAHTGKFSLKINTSDTEFTPIKIKNSEYFAVSPMQHPSLFSLSSANNSLYQSNGISVSVDRHKVYVSGTAKAGSYSSILALNSKQEIKYINQVTVGNSGNFSFDFVLPETGKYTVRVGSNSGSVSNFSIDISDSPKPIYTPDPAPTQPVDTYTNIVTLYVKPMYKAAEIAFCTTGKVNGTEKQIRILGGKRGDGVFRVGEDLAQGEWQTVTLNLMNLSEQTDDNNVKNLFVCVNEESVWEIDSVTSGYTEFHETNADMSKFATGNLEYSDTTGLKFTEHDADNDYKYDNYSTVTTSEFDISEKIAGFNVRSEFIKRESASGSASFDYTRNVTEISITGMTNGYVSNDGNTVYYNNSSDNNYIYKYDVINGNTEKILENTGTVSGCSNDGNLIMIDNVIYNLKNNTQITSDYDMYISPKGEIFGIKYNSAYKYYNGVFRKIYAISDEYPYAIAQIGFNSSENCIVLYCSGKAIIMQNDADSCKYITSVDNTTSISFLDWIALSDDGNKLYAEIKFDNGQSYTYVYNTNTGKQINTIYNTLSFLPGNKLLMKDGIYKMNSEYFYQSAYIEDTLTGEREYINYIVPSKAKYSSQANQFVYVSDSEITIISLGNVGASDKYLLSFDGKKTWLTYRGGSWINAYTGGTPTNSAMENYGMTADEMNSLTQNDFDSIYAKGKEVYTINIAIGMRSTIPYITPAVKSISIKTIAAQPVSCLYSSKLFAYSKADYNKISSIAAVESNPESGECYYILYIGNDWLYTFKDGDVVKIPYSANTLLTNIDTNWLSIKQYGMSASELRKIPEELLTNLFVNKELTNSEFGIIAVMRVNDDSTAKYKTQISMRSAANYLEDEEYYFIIETSGGNSITFEPGQITREQIDDFIAWMDTCRKGEGDVFYKLKHGSSVSFVNYYMITNVNVYTRSEYANRK